jgi:asparagine synthase (glutamine-hydrolysing)
MGGLAGYWGDPRPELVRAMTDRLAHRGPSAYAFHVVQGVGVLGHRGSAGAPIPNENRTGVVLMDGAIHDSRKLRAELIDRHTFRTDDPAEPVLHLFEEDGPAAIRKLDGAYALAIALGDDLFLARDPLGVKPLYLGTRDDGKGETTVLFASEIKALADLDLAIEPFPPGNCYLGDRSFLPFYRLADREPETRRFAVLVKLLTGNLETAVVNRLAGVGPVGVLLSGGLDSAILAAIARRHVRTLHTFAVGTRGSEDLAAARLVARHVGSEHHEYVLHPEEVARDLPTILYHLESFDAEMVGRAIPCFYGARLASDHVRAVLTGDGADELFAGHAHHREISDPSVLHAELRRSVESMHGLDLQRVDRMTAARGIEGRMPFLDLDLVHLAMTIPPRMKIHRRPGGTVVDKRILRAAFEDLLPPEIALRRPTPFDRGSGVGEILDTALSLVETDAGPPTDERERSGPMPRAAEESLYLRVLRDRFGEGAKSIIDVGSRWRDEGLALPVRASA